MKEGRGGADDGLGPSIFSKEGRRIRGTYLVVDGLNVVEIDTDQADCRLADSQSNV